MNANEAGVPAFERMLDYLLVACIFLLPHSYLIWMTSSEFRTSVAERGLLMALPAVVLALRLGFRHPREFRRIDPSTAGLFLFVLAVGFANALARTNYFGSTMWFYGQYIYWIAVAALFLRAVDRPADDLLHMIRRYFLVVSAAAVATAAAFWFFGPFEARGLIYASTPAGPVLQAENHYVTLVYSYRDVLGRAIPRMTFLYREPRIIGMHLVLGLGLQAGWYWAARRRGDRRATRRAAAGLVLMIVAMLAVHSFYGYVLAAMLGAQYLLLRTWPRFASGLRLGYVALIAAVALVWLVLFVDLGRPRELEPRVDAFVNDYYVRTPVVAGRSAFEIIGKDPRIISDYIVAYLSSPRSLFVYPFGSGVMNRDSIDYQARLEPPTAQGGTMIHVFAQQAGGMGLVCLVVIAWRVLGRLQRHVQLRTTAMQAAAAATGAVAIGWSAVFLDLISFAAWPVLFYALLLEEGSRRLPEADGLARGPVDA